MSTQTHDIPGSTQTLAAITPRTATVTLNGTSLDYLQCDGRCTAIQITGAVSGTTPTLAGKIQESADGNTWSDVTGATFTTVTTADTMQVISFARTLRYLRYVATLAGTSPSFVVAAVISQQKKLV